MNEMFECGDGETLVSYLYDELGPDERRVVAAHVAGCAACADALEGLGATRQQLAAWTPPEAAFDFRITREPVSAPVQAFPWWRQPMPAWMQAAAAVLVFGAGLSVGTLRGVGADAVAPAEPPASAAVTPSDLSGLEERLRGEMARMRTPVAQPQPVTASADRRSDDTVLRRVQTLIQESEERQRRELALRMTEVVRDVDVQRRADLTRVQQTMGQIEGSTGAELRQQREMWNLLMNNVSNRGAVR